MTITATDFQLSVNEYFTKLIQGEKVVIERYGKKFAVLLSYDDYQALKNQLDEQKQQLKEVSSQEEVSRVSEHDQKISTKEESHSKTDEINLTLDSADAQKLIKLMLKAA